MSTADKYELVRSSLESHTGKKKLNTYYSFVLCPFHTERTPSCQVWHNPHQQKFIGSFKCRGCGAHGGWNKIAEHFGFPTWSNKPTLDVPHLNFGNTDESLLGEQSSKKETLKLFKLGGLAAQYAGLSKDSWRGFSFEFLSSLNAKIAMVEETKRYYLYLPVIIKGTTRGYIKALPKKVDNYPSYLNAPGGWGIKYGLFPYDYSVALMKEKGLGTLVLVEGPRDALRLLSYGIPALAILGTQSWSKWKVRLLEFSGAKRLNLMLDGDLAGRKATRLLKTGVRLNDQVKEQVAPPLTELFDVTVFKLWEYELPPNFEESAYDPGNCPRSILRELKEQVYA